MFEHDAEVAKRILEKEKRVHDKRLTPFPDGAANGDVNIESNCFVLCLLYAMPQP